MLHISKCVGCGTDFEVGCLLTVCDYCFNKPLETIETRTLKIDDGIVYAWNINGDKKWVDIFFKWRIPEENSEKQAKKVYIADLSQQSTHNESRQHKTLKASITNRQVHPQADGQDQLVPPKVPL